jgi:hypothetical protein
MGYIPVDNMPPNSPRPEPPKGIDSSVMLPKGYSMSYVPVKNQLARTCNHCSAPIKTGQHICDWCRMPAPTAAEDEAETTTLYADNIPYCTVVSSPLGTDVIKMRDYISDSGFVESPLKYIKAPTKMETKEMKFKLHPPELIVICICSFLFAVCISMFWWI